MIKPILVLGGTAKQTHHYAAEWGLPHFLVQHIFSADDLRGKEPQPVLRVGLWYERQDLQEIEHIIHGWYVRLKAEQQEKFSGR